MGEAGIVQHSDDQEPVRASGSRPTHLFTVRIWRERLDAERTEIRFRVQHVLSGEVRYFREWEGVQAFLIAHSRGDPDDSTSSMPGGE